MCTLCSLRQTSEKIICVFIRISDTLGGFTVQFSGEFSKMEGGRRNKSQFIGICKTYFLLKLLFGCSLSAQFYCNMQLMQLKQNKQNY